MIFSISQSAQYIKINVPQDDHTGPVGIRDGKEL